MKKFMVGIMLAVMLVAAPVFAVQWITANQASVTWTAVTTLDNGDPVPAGNVIQYVVYLANSVTDPDKGNPAEVGTTNNTTFPFTLNMEGQFYTGVKAQRLVDGAMVNESMISWSDDPTKVATEPFGIRYYLAPTGPVGLSPVTG